MRNKKGQFIKGFKHTEASKKKMSLSRLGNSWGFKKGFSFWKNKKRSREDIKKMSKSHIGKYLAEDACNWKGDKVGYHGLHKWISRCLGKPKTCEYCKKTGLVGKKIHWANIDGKYKRDLGDWVRLCASCHLKFDRYKTIIIKKTNGITN